jgi:amino acid transporter
LSAETPQLAAAEAKNPLRNLSKAIRRVYIRLFLFYIGTFIIGLLVSSNNPLLNVNPNNASASPFVIVINQAGIRGLPTVGYRDIKPTANLTHYPCLCR